MSNEIKVGMEYGSYSDKMLSIEQNCIASCNDNPSKKGLESECIFRDAATKSLRGNSFREKISYNEYGQPKFSNATLFIDDYEYGVSSRSAESLDKFDYIQTEKSYALDLNGNGKVDDGEIFSGKLDRYAYKQAKDDGDLNKYIQYKNKFTY